jgi:hypothetical protein
VAETKNGTEGILTVLLDFKIQYITATNTQTSYTTVKTQSSKENEEEEEANISTEGYLNTLANKC